MPIKKFISAGDKWVKRCDEYKAKDRGYDSDHKRKVDENNALIKQCEANIASLESAARENEARIGEYFSETYLYSTYSRLSGVVSGFEISSDKCDRSSDIEREARALHQNLSDAKANRERIDRARAAIVQLDADHKRLKTDLRVDFAEMKTNFIARAQQEYGVYAAKCVKNYDASSAVPQNSSDLPEKIIFGNQHMYVPTLKNILNGGSLLMPYEVDVKHGGSFIINVAQSEFYNNEKLEALITGMLMKYIESFPATRMHLGVFSSTWQSLDKVGVLYREMKEAKCTLLDAAVTARGKLGELLDKIETYVRSPEDKIAKQSCSDIYDLYAQNPESDPFQIILLHNAFTDISEENLMKIYNYIVGYHRYGVRFIIVEDFSAINPRNTVGFANTLAEIKKRCTHIQFNGGSVTVDGISTDIISTAADFDRNKVSAYFKKYLAQKSTAPYLSYEKIGFGKEARDPKEYETLSIPVGMSGTTVQTVEFSCTFDEKHPVPLANLILGQSGTGKTRLIDAIIYNAAIKYSPDDIIFHLLDFKDGSMSATYLDDNNKIPHVKVASAKNNAEEAGFILDNIILENRERVEKFQTLAAKIGKKIDDISMYNRYIDENNLGIPKMPRLIIAVDECQTLFDEDVLAKQAENIIRKGRSQGIHLLLATQAMSSNMRKVVRFIDGLYVFEAVDEDIQTVLDKPYHQRVNKEAYKGSFQTFASKDKGKNCTKMKVAFYGSNPEKYSERIRSKWSTYPLDILKIGEDERLVVKADELHRLFAESGNFRVPLGENYQNRMPAIFDIGSLGYAPTLLVGSEERLSTNLCLSVMLSAKFNSIPIYAIDTSREQSLSRVKKECFPNNTMLEVGAGNKYRDMLTKVYRMYLERMDEYNNDPSKNFSPVAFIVNGAHSIPDYNNNAPYEEKPQSGGAENKSADLLQTSFKSMFGSILAPKASADKAQKELKISARSALIELVSSGKKYGIYVCVSFDKNDASAERREFRDGCDIKLLFPAFKTHKESYMDDSFKEKMLARINNNMAFVEHSVDGMRTFKRMRVYQYDLDDAAVIDFIKNFKI